MRRCLPTATPGGACLRRHSAGSVPARFHRGSARMGDAVTRMAADHGGKRNRFDRLRRNPDIRRFLGDADEK